MLWELMEAVPVAKRGRAKAGLKRCFEHRNFPVFLYWMARGFRDGMIPGLSRCDMGRRGMKKKKEGFEST